MPLVRPTPTSGNVDGTIRIGTSMDTKGFATGAKSLSRSAHGALNDVLFSVARVGSVVKGITNGIMDRFTHLFHGIRRLAHMAFTALFYSALFGIIIGVSRLITESLDNMVKAMTGSTREQIDALKNKWQEVRTSIVLAFLPLIITAIPYIQAAMEWLTKMLNIVAQVTASLLHQKSVWQVIPGSAAKLAKQLEASKKSAQSILAAFDQLNVLQQKQAEQPESTVALQQVPISEEAIGIADKIKDKIQELKDKWSDFVDGVKDKWEGTKEVIERAWNRTKEFLANEWEGLKQAWARTVEFVQNEWADIKEVLGRAWTRTKEFLTNEWEDLKRAWTRTVDFIGNEWEGIKEAIESVWTNTKNFLEDEWEGLKTAWSRTVAFINNEWNTILSVAGTIWTSLVASATTAWNNIKAIWNGAGDWFVGIANSIMSAFVTVFNWLRSQWSEIFEGVKDISKNAINTVIDLLNGLLRSIVSGINGMIGMLNSIEIDIPEWVPIFGGQSWSVSIPTISAPHIPRLATGAVIPPNSQFLAMLGDQRSGTNIEAPADLIRQIVREEMSGGGDINVTMPVYLDGEKIYQNQRRIQTRHGTSLIASGSVS